MSRRAIKAAAATVCAVAVLATTAGAGNAAGRENGYGYPTTEEYRAAASSQQFYKEMAWLH